MQVRYRPYNNILPTTKKFIKTHTQKSIEIQSENKNDIVSDVHESPSTTKQEQVVQTMLQPRIYGPGLDKPRIRIKTDLAIAPDNVNTQLFQNSESTIDS